MNIELVTSQHNGGRRELDQITLFSATLTLQHGVLPQTRTMRFFQYSI